MKLKEKKFKNTSMNGDIHFIGFKFFWRRIERSKDGTSSRSFETYSIKWRSSTPLFISYHDEAIKI